MQVTVVSELMEQVGSMIKEIHSIIEGLRTRVV